MLSHDSYNMDTVFVSLVNVEHFDAFRIELREHMATMRTCVALTNNHGMIGIVNHVTKKGIAAGFLNPSDVQAVRQGFMGMFWFNGHIALEELLAVQTTLLLQHVDVNPSAWTTPSKPIPDLSW